MDNAERGAAWVGPEQSPRPSEPSYSDGDDVRATGVARKIQQRTVAQQQRGEVIAFILERRDSDGNAQTPIPVEIRGQVLRGHVSEGDRLLVAGRWKDGLLVASLAQNLDHGNSEIRPRDQRDQTRNLAIFVAITAALFLIVLLAARAQTAKVEKSAEDAARQMAEFERENRAKMEEARMRTEESRREKQAKMDEVRKSEKEGGGKGPPRR